MNNRIELVLPPEQAADEKGFRVLIARAQGIPEHELGQFRLLRRSIDARSRQPKIRLIFELASGKESLLQQESESRHYQFTGNNTPVAVIGSGPAGLFAAIRLIELGYKPVIIERGKDVRERRRDLAVLHREMQVNPDSNYCFGEGGAGTYSDGKLYTRSDKRGNVRKVLDTLIEHGADPAIGIDAHPHIGTNKLPGIISSIRERIIACGGEVHFNTRLAGIKHQGGKLTGATLQHIGNSYTFDLPVQALILATGHSARDIYQMLHEQGILIEQKPFALGVRIEHPQQLIDSIQYHCESRGPYLPAASYSLSAQSGGRGVYSFCMCPGGIIAAAATAPGEVVVNGWSPSKRNNKFANSGIVVSVGEDDFKPFDTHGPLKAMHFQSAVEQKAFRAAGSTLKAPAQRLNDFLNNKTSATLPDCSYFPGIVSVQLDEVLPPQVTDALRKGIREFGNKMRGYNTNEAVLVATESRTSSPVRIPRDPQSHMHPQIAGLFPCGEGAGYAGGIMSAAMDGERCADSVMTFLGAGKDI